MQKRMQYFYHSIIFGIIYINFARASVFVKFLSCKHCKKKCAVFGNRSDIQGLHIRNVVRSYGKARKGVYDPCYWYRVASYLVYPAMGLEIGSLVYNALSPCLR